MSIFLGEKSYLDLLSIVISKASLLAEVLE